MMRRYNPKEIEPRWQKTWDEQQLYEAVDFDERPKFVMLTEFPYPSGDGLHMGHIREYTYGDMLARHQRMQGRNVLYPMGFDEFGLPTENFAIKNKVTPQSATAKNVATFEQQMRSLGYGFDWSRKVNTSDPRYYRWTQWLFLQFFQAGLAYQDEIAINWCPHCKTGLSNEEVVNGRHERCDTLVEKKLLKQWLLKITQYADRLLEGLKHVDYPPRIADQQINWIGRSEGAEIDFGLDFGSADTNAQLGPDDRPPHITVFTTRPDTVFGATFLVLAPEHPWVTAALEHKTVLHNNDKVAQYVQQAKHKTDLERQSDTKDKTGVRLEGVAAINPANRAHLPIFIADYVLAGYGTGAIMAVPAHDERDWEFAKQYDLPITRVIKNNDPDDACTTKPGVLIHSGDFDGMESNKAKAAITELIEKEGFGRARIQYKLRDWIFSRQHYWGEPIPIIHCPEHGAVAVPDDQLPVELPEVEHYEPTDTGESPLAAITDWVNTTCPACGGKAKRETDTMPNWAGSSWYYLRYYDPHNDQAFADRKKLDYWGEVDLYLGGMEHTTLHLLYSRFWHQFFYDQKLVPTPEPYRARRGQGIILAADGSKMSKSKGNVVNPSDIIDSGYGADALRISIAFLAPYDQTTPWSPESVAGTHRFLQRVWVLAQEFLEYQTAHSDEPADSTAVEAALLRTTHRTIKKVSDDLNNLAFNTAIAALMQAVNELYKQKEAEGFAVGDNWRFAIESLLLILAPFAPHLTEELWRQLGHDTSIHLTPWPEHDEQYLTDELATIVIQVNGKLRGEMQAAPDTPEDKITAAARQHDKVAGYLEGQTIRKTVYVPGRLINFVI